MKRTITTLILTLVLGCAGAARAAVTGQWDFNSSNLTATVGADLAYMGDIELSTTFTTATIGGSNAVVMGFPAATVSQGYIMTHGIAPNGGGSYVNQFTLIMDIMFPTESSGKWRGLLQTSTANANDADLFVNTANGIGISGAYSGSILPDTWHRVAFVFDLTLPSARLRKYIDGLEVGAQNLDGLDGRWSLDPTALLFTDNDGETAAGFVNSIQIRDEPLTASDIFALGKATAAGIPTTIPVLTNLVVIVVQPASQTVLFGSNATFTVVASGDPPLSYQWRKGGVELNGATNAAYTIRGATLRDAGLYDVVVADGFGRSTRSAVATLTVQLPPGSPRITVEWVKKPGTWDHIPYLKDLGIGTETGYACLRGYEDFTGLEPYYGWQSVDKFNLTNGVSEGIGVAGLINAIQVAASGNVYMGGADLAPGYYPESFTDGPGGVLFALNGVGATIRGITNSIGNIQAIGIDSAENVYALAGGRLTKYDSSLNLLWSTNISGSALAVDRAGNSYLCGGEALLRQITPNGSPGWALPPIANLSAVSVAVDSEGDCFIAGNCSANITLGGVALTNGGGFVAQYSTGGHLLWARQICSEPVTCANVAVNGEDLVGVFGSFTGMRMIGTNVISSLHYEGAVALQDGYVAVFSQSGEIIGARALGFASNPGTFNDCIPGERYTPTRAKGSPGNRFFAGGQVIQGYSACNLHVFYSAVYGSIVIDFPPVVAAFIAEDPVSRTVIPGSSTAFVVQSGGTPPLYYQWFRNNVPLSGTTNAELWLAAVTEADIGEYKVVVSNTWDCVTSAVVALTLAAPGNPELAPEFDWAMRIGGTGSEALGDLVIDGNRNFYLLGTLPGGTGSKYNFERGLMWSKSLPAASISVSPAGNVSFAGTFSESLDVGGTVLRHPVPAAWLAQYTGRGAFRWAAKVDYNTFAAGGSSGYIVSSDRLGNTYLGGLSGYNKFVRKCDPTGVAVWADWEYSGYVAEGWCRANLNGWGGYSYVGSYPFCVRFFDSEGGFGSIRLNLYPPHAMAAGPDGDIYISGNDNGPVLLKHDKTGQLVWEKRLAQYASLLTTDLDGNLYLSGAYAEQALFDDIVLTGGSNYLAQFDPDGGAVWARNLPAPARIVLDPAGERYVAGTFSGAIQFGTNSLTSAGGADVFIARLAPGPTRAAPMFTLHPQSQEVVVGTGVTLSADAFGTRPVRFQWCFEGRIIPAETNKTLVISPTSPGDAGLYSVIAANRVGAATSSVAMLSFVAPPQILGQPSSQGAVVGESVTFRVTAAGSPPLFYQWLFNGSPLAGATGSSLVLDNVQPAQEGLYSVRVTNIAGAVTSAEALLSVWIPAFVAVHPTDQTVFAGASASFSVQGAGTLPLSYQWLRDGAPLPGATASSLTLQNVQALDAGALQAVVSNAYGSATSRVARLVVKYVDVFADGRLVTATSGTYTGAVAIALESAYEGGILFYTLDGSAPTYSARIYRGPFTVTGDAVLRVLAYSADFLSWGESTPFQIQIIPAFTLTATTKGGGLITLDPAAGPHPSNTLITATAIASNGWTFLKWHGDALGTNPVQQVALTRDKYIEAVFGTTLTASSVGGGIVSIAPASVYHPYGSSVQLSAQPQAGSYFVVWAGAASGTGNPLYLTMTNPAPAVSSLFGALPAGQFALTLVPVGGGRIFSSPRANAHANGTTVVLTPIPDPGQTFVGWGGDASGMSVPLSVTMNASKTITARFTSQPLLSVPPGLAGLTKDGFRLFVTGECGVAYTVLVSTNLTDWTARGSTTNTYGTAQFDDTAAPSAGPRFYRVLQE